MKHQYPLKYIPNKLTKKDKGKQLHMLNRSKKMYKKHKYFTRKKISSYNTKKSSHVLDARRIYKINSVTPNKELSRKTGCTVHSLRQIVRKGEGAYYSSGSRPNQTPQSWGLARLASSITGGKAAAVDYSILEKGCNHRKPAFILANAARKKHGHGNSKTKKITLKTPKQTSP